MLSLSPQVFAIMTQLIEERAGLHYLPADSSLLETKVAQRAVDLGLDSLLDYYYYLRYDPGGARELQALVESLVVHETYLFREPEGLAVLVNSIVPELLRTRPTLRLWSAACATGEEPYSVAMLLAEAGLLERVQIVATDISERALARAREAWYGGRSLRGIAGVRAAAQLETFGEGVRVPEGIRRKVTWRHVNLVDRVAVSELGTFDVVICRNVLIYFADATVASVAATLSERLASDGVLMVGASESLLRFGTIFVCEEHGGSFFYRKPGQ